MNTLLEDKTVFQRILSLWQTVFGDEEEYIRAFYRSFDTDGNVFYAVYGRDGIQITSDLSMKDGAVIGLVNRVPLKLCLNHKIVEGYYIYAGCVDPAYRGYGIYRDIMREAERDTLFTVLIPANEPLFDMYRKLGYTETSGTPFPFEADRSQLRSIDTEPFDGDTDLLYRFYLKAEGDRFIKEKPFFLLTVSDFAAEGQLFYIKDTHGQRCGFIIYSANKNTIKIYDMCCLPHKKFDIMESNIASAGKIRCKSMIRGITEAPGLNMFGEY
ncbi:MAG: GNAT family N-acetyltransferase [Eubacteriales bacterium]